MAPFAHLFLQVTPETETLPTDGAGTTQSQASSTLEGIGLEREGVWGEANMGHHMRMTLGVFNRKRIY